ncbi:PREDICTED: transcription termination factor MTERF5, chloroplastic-like [Nelumbo nucifera]|uniref:Transcription termination factor MTERF5, chloroplastic-like n=2 Tax=Nelumbo nucifera TaxID=4432 RepID=A0A1U8AV23_NELNU|nr:PREDICTED: transcription termination factor MTERF5, chloroplastic-like [Nelumbo nucifera]XP_010270367.1 PREDICTED: transcription termination factor MTERF5, chloroplastic-like [Nelumbo nucifera]DAD39867.1 TPA_asm: hypothetical protein HUJ06_014190 [Nelumbo nucifera]
MFGFQPHHLLLQFARIGDTITTTSYLKHFPESAFKRLLSHISTSKDKLSSFTVSYLVNSCGLSSETALSVAKKVYLKCQSKPDSILKLFKTHGFTKTQIATIISKSPNVLLADPRKTVEPKLQFFRRVGLSVPDLMKVLYLNPGIFKTSLEDKIIPSWKFLKTLRHTDEKVASSIMNAMAKRALQHYSPKSLAPKIAFLRDVGVPESNISKMLLLLPTAIRRSTYRFNELVREISEVGFDPSTTFFLKALHVKASVSKATWEAKFALFRNFGWSDNEILLAFRRSPYCMLASKKNIGSKLDFLMNKQNLKPADICKHPQIFTYNLEKRIIPRWFVTQVLLSKGLIKKDLALNTVFSISDSLFLEKFVIKYKDETAELLKVYQGAWENH